jgi:aquaporin Z
MTASKAAPTQRAAPSKQAQKAWRLWLSEFAGTAILVSVGLSLVIAINSPSGPFAGDLRQGPRLAVTGFLFGTTGALIAVSPLGKVSGAHINPVVTVLFVLRRGMKPWLAAGYIAAQLAGAVAGAAPLLAWGRIGEQVHLGATLPGRGYGAAGALAGEAATTATLVVLLLVFVGTDRLRRYTPLLFPILYCLMVWLEAPVSGTSTNPARSLGPEVVASLWRAWWVYWAGPLLGALVGVGITLVHPFRELEIVSSKVYHFEQDRHGLLH